MSDKSCVMCDDREPNPCNPHGWCDECETQFSGVLESMAHQCQNCVTPQTCMMRQRCEIRRKEDLPHYGHAYEHETSAKA